MSIVAFVGIDAHTQSDTVCVLTSDSVRPVLRETIPHDEMEVKRFFGKLAKSYDLRCCYEASVCGFTLYRWLDQINVACDVIAPSLIPQRPGDRIKTDRRDAYKLADLHRCGQLTAVRVPTPEEESIRRAVRLRDDILRDVVEAKNLVRKFLTGHGRRYTQGKSYWTQAHWAWLRKQSFDFEHDNFAYRKLLGLLDFKKACLDEADRHIARLAQSEAFEEPVRRLCSLRGVGIVTAMTLITEVIDFRRFPKASSLMKFLGLVCRENSSGEQRNRSSITKTGNSRCRRVLVEAAWKYAHKPALPKALKERQEGLPGDIVAHSWAAQHRLYHKFWSIAKRKERAKAAVAVARELVGFIWAIMLMDSGKQPCDNNTGTIAAD